ncbi:synaptonemal complex protein 2-like [Protopterus annectens]|uniref:synaptonemal complex protein 2-like n=1 Tax=Protopterus annectens TaxID=7888 RepID=UPI001CFB925A|nr:synaptonemal complex protein 2-like [Protopterus annectens]
MANLEYLLGEALKGKGLQKIEQVLEEDALPVQKCSRLLMGKLDKLVNKELDKNDFKNVSLLLKCVQCFSRNDSSDGFVWLLQQGLVAKMTMWFERVTEFLKSLDLLVDKSLPRLAEDFYCTVQVVCSNSSEADMSGI